MSIVEVIGQAFKLAVLTITEAIKIADEHAEAVAAAKDRRSLFERALASAIERMQIDTVAEKHAVDSVDEAVDEASKKL